MKSKSCIQHEVGLSELLLALFHNNFSWWECILTLSSQQC